MMVSHNVHRLAHPAPLAGISGPVKRPDIIRLAHVPVLAPGMHFAQGAASSGQGPGCQLTNLFGNHAVSIASATDVHTDFPATPKKHGWLPLLTVLFLISYGLMTMLIVEQGQTIESQRTLIRELFRDSTELSTLKMKAQQDRTQLPSAQTQAPATQNRSSQHPSSQYPSTQAPANQAPSSQAGAQHGAQNQAEKQKPQFRMPSKPASDLIDDVRTLTTI
jgi:hypothetical protein